MTTSRHQAAPPRAAGTKPASPLGIALNDIRLGIIADAPAIAAESPLPDIVVEAFLAAIDRLLLALLALIEGLAANPAPQAPPARTPSPHTRLRNRPAPGRRRIRRRALPLRARRLRRTAPTRRPPRARADARPRTLPNPAPRPFPPRAAPRARAPPARPTTCAHPPPPAPARGNAGARPPPGCCLTR